MAESGRVPESKYTLTFAIKAVNDLAFHRKAGNKATIKRIDRILEELENTPFTGIGNPHELVENLSGQWSRHISKKDVMVYEVDEIENIVHIHSARFHYSDK